MTFRKTIGIVLGLMLALALAACGEAEADTPGLEPSDRFIPVHATEFDWRRTLEQDPFPQATLDEWPEYFGDDGRGGSGGYYLFMTSDDEWRIGSYVFLPQEITLVQGDRVTMEVFGVRGSIHENVIVGPEGFEPIRFDVKRGELKQVEFTVDQPGIYQLICMTHAPTMTTTMLALPSG